MATKFVDVSTSLQRLDWANYTDFSNGTKLSNEIGASDQWKIDEALHNSDYYYDFTRSSADVFIGGGYYDYYDPLYYEMYGYGGQSAYILDVNLNAEDGFDIKSFDVTINLDNYLFDISDLSINSGFQAFNSTSIDYLDYHNGEIRVVGGSADNIGLGEGLGNEGTSFQLLLTTEDFMDPYMYDPFYYDYGYWGDTAITSTVNSTDTILTQQGDESQIYNAESSSNTDYYSVESGYFEINLDSTVDFLTEREIGGDKLSRLVREGDTLVSNGEINVTTHGNIASHLELYVDDYGIDNVANITFTGSGYEHTYGDFFHWDDHRTYDLNMEVTGTAGEVINLNDVYVYANNYQYDPLYYDMYGCGQTSLDGQILITYQSDVSYDGRVSMKDLAYLNAGAAAGYSEDVDVNYDGVIDIGDLAKMDEQWGESLHNFVTNDGGDTFTGTNGKSIFFDSMANNYNDTVDDQAFLDQNAIENDPSFLGSLAGSGSQHYLDAPALPDEILENAGDETIA